MASEGIDGLHGEIERLKNESDLSISYAGEAVPIESGDVLPLEKVLPSRWAVQAAYDVKQG